MLDSLTNLVKAAAATVCAVPALAADLLTLPASSYDPHRAPFERTAKMLSAAGDCVSEAVKPTRQ